MAGDLDAFYGNPRGIGGRADAGWEAANVIKVICPWKNHSGNSFSIQIHKKAADSLSRVLAAAWDYAGRDQSKIAQAHIDQFDGSYNYRSNVNSPSKLSLHGYAAALDWAAAYNPNGRRWVDGGSMLPRWFIDCFLAEGWCWGGDFGGTADAMHFQATFNRHDDADTPQPQPHSVQTLPPELHPAQKNTHIICTVFGGSADANQSAYDGHWITDTEPGCALPFHFPKPVPRITIIGPRGTVTVPIVDVGPLSKAWPTPAGDTYWTTGARPRAETIGYRSKAGIDLTPATAKAVGIDGKGFVDWYFATGGDVMTDQTTTQTGIPGLPGFSQFPGFPTPHLDPNALAAGHQAVDVFLKVAPQALPILSVLFPQLGAVGPALIAALPALTAAHNLFGQLEQAGGDPTKTIGALEGHMSDIQGIIERVKTLVPHQ